jgi:hypothetical protein
MRELIGYLVACSGAEQAVARRAGGAPQQFQCKQFLCKQFPRKEDLIDRVRSDSPITVFYAGQSLTGDATDIVAGGNARLWPVRLRLPSRATGKGAGRM